MYRFLVALLAISCLFFDSEGCSRKKETCKDGILNQDEERTDCGGSCPACPEFEFVQYDLNDDSSDDNEFDGGILTGGIIKDDENSPNNELPCKPSITLCSKVNGQPVCKKGGVWMRQNFNKDAESWRIKTPLMTSQGRRNCHFELYEYPGFSKQGEHKLVKPGTNEEIFWNIRSLRKSKYGMP